MTPCFDNVDRECLQRALRNLRLDLEECDREEWTHAEFIDRLRQRADCEETFGPTWQRKHGQAVAAQ